MAGVNVEEALAAVPPANSLILAERCTALDGGPNLVISVCFINIKTVGLAGVQQEAPDSGRVKET